MIRRMIAHTLLAALLVAAAGFSYQAFAQGEGVAGAAASLSGVLLGGDRHGGGHDDD